MFLVSRQVSTSALYSISGGTIELPATTFVHTRASPDIIRLTVSTTYANGLLLWQGQKPTGIRSGRDFIALLLNNGHVVFRCVIN